MFVGLTGGSNMHTQPEITKSYNNKSPDPNVDTRRGSIRLKGNWLEIFKTSTVPTCCPDRLLKNPSLTLDKLRANARSVENIETFRSWRACRTTNKDFSATCQA
jgi:hypothetical protein